MEGWIKLHRQITYNPFWNEKPFSKGQALTDLFLMANHKEAKIMIGNNLVTVEKGSFITSELKLSEKWGWSRKKVRSFLQVLERDNTLVKKSTTKYTTVTLLQWDLYQGEGTTEEQQKNNKRTTKEQQKNTNKNVKNEKNEENVKNIKHIYGEYKNVKLTDDEFEKLNNDFDNSSELIIFLDEYIEMKGYKAKSHYLAIKKWVVNAVKEDRNKIRKTNNNDTGDNIFMQIAKEEGLM